jgi:hypothetical protein
MRKTAVASNVGEEDLAISTTKAFYQSYVWTEQTRQIFPLIECHQDLHYIIAAKNQRIFVLEPPLLFPSHRDFMASTLPQFNWLPLRAYLFRLPLLTRVTICLIFAIWIIGVQSVWDMRQWGSLIPSEVGLTSSKLYLPRSSTSFSIPTLYLFRCL